MRQPRPADPPPAASRSQRPRGGPPTADAVPVRATSTVHDTDCHEFDTEALPELLARSDPEPPAGWTGSVTVMVHALVREDGSVSETRVVPVAPDLDAAAVACVRKWRFRPGAHCGHAMPAWVAIPVRFERQ